MDKQIISYKMSDCMNGEVQAAIDDGWQPYGNPFDNGAGYCLQPVVKYAEEQTPKMSNCCSAAVSDPSGEGIEGRCKDCGEMCQIVSEEE